MKEEKSLEKDLRQKEVPELIKELGVMLSLLDGYHKTIAQEYKKKNFKIASSFCFGLQLKMKIIEMFHLRVLKERIENER